MFQRLVITIYAIYLLCSYVSYGYVASNHTSCESNVEPKLRNCRRDEFEDESGDFLDDSMITGLELFTFTSKICNAIPSLLGCVTKVIEECPSYGVSQRLINLERTSGLCDGKIPVNWLGEALLTMNDLNVTCVVKYAGPTFHICAENSPGDGQIGGNTEQRDMMTSLFECMRTELPAITSLQTVCGTSVREVLLVHLAFSAKSLVLPSDEELRMIRTGLRQ